jgi:mannose-6-phosphate isomerase-like protein (cupin superfamily)
MLIAESIKEEYSREDRIERIIKNDSFPKLVEKVWGSEHILSYNKDYCFKRITVKAGFRTSLQYHELKTETNFLAEGIAVYHWIDTEGQHNKIVNPGFLITLNPGEIHRFEAITDIVLMEASSPEIWDVVRLEDSYGREGTSAP